MEFYGAAEHPRTAEQIRDGVTGPRLAEFCDSIDEVLCWDASSDTGEMYLKAYPTYRKRTDREIRVFALTRR